MPKISELPSTTALTGDDYLVLVNAPGTTPVTQRITAANAALYLTSAETYQDHGNAGSTETIDYATARTHRIVLDSAACALTFTGWPASGSNAELKLIVVHDATTSVRAITWPAVARFPNATAPFLPTTTASDRSKLIVSTTDGGTTVDVDLIGTSYG